MGSRVLKRRTGTKRKKPVTGLVYALSTLAILCVCGVVGVFALCNSWLQDLPDYADSSQYELAKKTRVYASDEKTLLAEFYLEDRDPVTADQVSDYVLKGTVATEDERFYEHSGIDPQGILRAVVVNVTGMGHEGASTITQQLVRNTVLASEANESTIKRKVREAYIAVKLEEIYSKDEILLMYLNTINYGSGCYGIQAAAQKYYSKNASELTLNEAATLIGIPQSPTNNNPIDNPENCKDRRDVVLMRMLSNGVITQADYDKTISQGLDLDIRDTSSNDGIYLYPYFTSYVRDTLLETYTVDELYCGGYNIYTTLDVNLQKKAEKAAREKEATVDDDMEVALSVVSPKNGSIQAIVGGKNYKKDQYNLATQAQRQAGSSFKTFTLLAALEDGVSPSTTLNCSSKCTIDGWNVENFDGANYGTRSLASAFEVSSNTGFARLVTYLGPEKVVDVAERCGIKSTLSPVPSITLGTQGVTTLDMANAYATIANGGTYHESYAVSRIENSEGETVYEHQEVSERVLSEEVACAAIKVMEGVITRGTGTDAKITTGQPAAGKTGTTENFRDSWFCGFTPQYSVAVWMGCRQERTMNPNYTASSVFGHFMSNVLSGKDIVQFPTAADPEYKSVSDKKLGISGGGSSTGESESTKGETTSTQNDNSGNSGNSGNSNNNGNGGNSGTNGNGNSSSSSSSSGGSSEKPTTPSSSSSASGGGGTPSKPGTTS